MRWLTNPVAQFLATGFVTLVVVIVATSALSRSAADEEAVADARSLTRVLGNSVAQPAIPRGLVDGDAGAIVVDGSRLTGPYTLLVIGPAQTMQTALQIPGGVVASVESAGGSVTMEPRGLVEVTALRDPTSLRYARPVS